MNGKDKVEGNKHYITTIILQYKPKIMVNKVVLIGNVGKDAELKTLQNDTKVASFSLATSESYKDRNGEWQTKTEWHFVVCWKSLAERASKQIKKGLPVFVEGKLTYRKWEDRDGVTRQRTEVVASTFKLLAKPERKENGAATTTASNPVGGTGDDDLPF